jgi:radical SAM superfamily enzyme YgiQ (UPF0313 family)
VRVLLVSTYDLGRQPFGLASAAAWLRRAGVDVASVDASRSRLEDDEIAGATLVAFFLPMHTATRLAVPMIDRVRRVNPSASVCAYGLYAQLNAAWLREHGVSTVLGPEFEEALVALASGSRNSQSPNPKSRGDLPRLAFIQPDRTDLPPLAKYASLQMPDGTRRVVGATDATRGCKHLCRHCPIVPVYRGQFRVVPVEVVLADVRAQVASGAQHITFGDPDFFNGPAHARRIVEQLAAECPGVTYDVTIKIEHLLRHAELLPVLHDTGCLFVTSAVESVDDEVLGKLAKGHTRADFVRAVEVCRDAGLTLSPTFVAFTPWTTVEGYLDLLDTIEALDLVEQIAPIQLAIRLLVTAGSPLLELPDIGALVEPFDTGSLTWPWRHPDRRVDVLQKDITRLVDVKLSASRSALFETVVDLARSSARATPRTSTRASRNRATVPYLNEPWYC